MAGKLALRPISVALASVFILNGCATTQGGAQHQTVGGVLKDTFNNDDPCANSKRNIGILTGALAGAAIAATTQDKNKGMAMLIGALAGGGIGALIGSQLDKRECELAKIQKKYEADIEATRLATVAATPAKTSSAKLGEPKQQEMGMSVNIVDQEGKPQFESSSDKLTPEALAMFQDIAKQYVPPKESENKKLSEAVKNRRVLLIGHTDDTGSSELNADLSERRAKTVAKILAVAGVPESMIYYQGAGETLPRADNSTTEGRSKNRRVEIVDLNDEVAFSTYLENRRPNTGFYRPADEVQRVTVKPSNTASTAGKEDSASKKPVKTTAVQIERTAQAPASYFDFGGKPYTTKVAMVNTGQFVTAKSSSGFSLISEAQASNMERIQSCDLDRPRNAGLVKSLKDGSPYKTSEYMPGLYGRTWADMVNGNLVVLNKVTVLRDGVIPANKPELKVYKNYKNNSKEAQPDLMLNPDVNAYQTSNGVLYRVFANGERGVQCMDILIPASAQQRTAKDGKLIYGHGAEFVSDFKPTIKN